MITPVEAANNLATALGGVSLGLAGLAVVGASLGVMAPAHRKSTTTLAGVCLVFLVVFAFLAVLALVVGPWVLG